MMACLITDEKFIPRWPTWKYTGAKEDIPKAGNRNGHDTKGYIRRAGHRAMHRFWKSSTQTPDYPTGLPTPEVLLSVFKLVFPGLKDMQVLRKWK